MNTSEKKPDWWFFGSYAVLNLNKTWYEINFYDSYYPRQVKKVAVQMPNRVKPLNQWKMYEFLWINKIWFTDMDGENLKNIYEKTFDEKIDWVIFVKYDIFNFLINGFREKSYEREYLNATAISRWNTIQDQKKNYFDEINKLSNWINKFQLISKLINNLDIIIEKWYIRFYIPWVSENFQNLLKEKNLTLSYFSWNIYSFDYNFGGNKIDKFIQKKIILIKNNEIILQKNWDFLNISKYWTWNFEINIFYNLNIPNSYFEFINYLNKKYNLELNEKEKNILCIDTNRHNQWAIYLSRNTKVFSVTGDFYNSYLFDTPFSKNIIYQSKYSWYNLEKIVKIHIEIY